MKLLSAAVRNYRLHRELTVEFDPLRTLIGGPNEVGKSTFIEAVHRGLFLKAKGTGAMHKSMASTLHAGHPEVGISFEAGGHTYTLRKRFSGQSGTTQLSEVGGQSWQGDDAEEKLASLLGSEDATGRSTASKINEQWAHLWVWQGMSGDNPAEHAASQQTELLQRLQDTGGSVAMQSELDAKVANRFAKAREQTFVRAGSAKAGSDLERAQTELRKAETLHTTASERLGKLQLAMSDYETAEATLHRTASDLEELRKQQQAVREKISQAEGLQQVEREQEATVVTAKDKLGSLETTEESIVELRKRIDELQDALKPKQEELAQAEARIADLRKRAGEADRELQDAQIGTRNARLGRDLATAYVSVYEKQARLDEIQKRLDRVRALQSDIDGYRSRLSELPEIDRDALEEIQAIESELGQARAALNAMAAEIEIVSADQAVRVGDQPLETGGSRTIAEATDVNVGDSVCLRIHPGGGDSLGEARETARSLNVRLQSTLDQYGIESTKRASEVVAAREDLRGKIDGAGSTLEELDPEATADAQSAAKDELTAAEAEVTRRLENVKSLDAPENLAAARVLRDAQDESVQNAEGNESSLKATRDALHGQMTELDGQLSTLREGIAEDQRTLTGSEAQLDLLLQNHGDDASRGEAIEATRKSLADTEQEFAKTQKALEELQPALLTSDRDRLERSINEANKQREGAQTAKAVSQATLRSDGTEDPKASLAQAEARLNAAREHFQSVSRKASAIALLDDLFQEQQQALADRFSQPLADKVTGYLQCLFGANARAVVTFEDNAFKAIELVRSSQAGATAFDALSGGTREQVAAAVRLAIAELLAAEHDGVLPVVFDDAFAYSDPQRVQVLQRMLDLGATRGLQVIVLTCNPSDYAALGARQVILSREATQALSSSEVPSPNGDEPTSAAAPTASDASEEDCDRLLSVLLEMGGRSGNHSLRDQLGWDDAKYIAAKDQLLAQGRIFPGKGRGGSVAIKE
ncbi:MAG: AAA family ATPase [Opitutaceae bacterium]